jgi:hypothetical protein
MSFYFPGLLRDVQIAGDAGIAGTKINPVFGAQVVDTAAVASLSRMMFAMAVRGAGIGVAGQPLYGVGPAVSGDTPLGINPGDFYPLHLASGSFM